MMNSLEAIEKLIEEIRAQQQINLYRIGRRMIPNLTEEDLLQPNDFPELETHPEFRYEEGVLAGIQTIQMAIRALTVKGKNDQSSL